MLITITVKTTTRFSEPRPTLVLLKSNVKVEWGHLGLLCIFAKDTRLHKAAVAIHSFSDTNVCTKQGRRRVQISGGARSTGWG